MRSFYTQFYRIVDFLEWHSKNLLELVPDFQRESGWSLLAKSSLIDKILRGKPIHSMSIRQEINGSRTKKILIDGKQRLTTIIEFTNDKFALSDTQDKELVGKFFSTLTEDLQKKILRHKLFVFRFNGPAIPF